MTRRTLTAPGRPASSMLVVGVAAALVLGACSGADDASGPGASGSSTTSAGATASSGPTQPTRSPAPTSATTKPASTASTTFTPGSTATAVPTGTRITRPSQPLTSPATFGSGVSVEVTRMRAVKVTGVGAGETSGPAVAFTLRLTNDSTRAIDVTQSIVAADYGKARTPAGDSSAKPYAPFRGQVATGRSVQGTYVFLVPAKKRSHVRLAVSWSASQPVVVLVGDARS